VQKARAIKKEKGVKICFSSKTRHCPKTLVRSLYWYLYRSKFIVQLQILFVAH